MVMATPPLCANGCGFYGSVETEFMLPLQNSRPGVKAATLGLMGFTCRCGKVFCQLHRYPSEHSCNYDFKKADRQVLDKENPVIKGDKLKSRM
ncbi:Zinc finger A20 and AN1 domain-containing stress-associated protein 5 [Hibiscus syriacus]|uniref:Zinc finger A20 and AN1 domain-containing stress-associated protein 5 n=1 Tax=Hibiscus syriacus TaxID=106335 RepID=A0A6A2XV62_HIBSY|nr:zinc finger A20 and AN1 domain-containing stress-associated protein 5-like [Hibiscus syriacus]KAE8673830.1 Zinc finger A20 and AN1 domain-containing stress-associated protein 5 [Hibiscus syriacus]